MKTFFYTLVGLIIQLNCVAQIPNNGFENWTVVGAYNTPDGWGNINAVTNPAGIYTCEKGTPGNPGSSYLKLTSKTTPGGVAPGIAASGTINTMSFQVEGGFPYTNRAQELRGNWAFMGYSGDVGFISVFLTKWDNILHTRDTVAKVKHLLTGMIMLPMVPFTIALNYQNGSSPDTALIILSASGTSPKNYSFLYVDDLSFFGTVDGINETETQPLFSVYPSPTLNSCTIDYNTQNELAEIIITNLLGEAVYTTTIRGQGSLQLSTSNFSKGVYVVNFQTKTKRIVEKLIIN